MIVDRQSRSWIVGCLVIFAIATATYIPYARAQLNGPSGGSWHGLTYGVVGTLMILFAMLLSFRKKVRTMRIGRAYWWMQGHIWFGLLSYPIILYHAGFRWGGTLTQVLMWLFTIIIVSGIIGLIFQQFIPTLILRRVPMESTYENHPLVLAALREEAERLIPSQEVRDEAEINVDAIPAGSATATLMATETSVAETRLREFYTRHVKPFLLDEPAPNLSLASDLSANSMFDELGRMLPASMKSIAQDLKEICDERRQIIRHRRFYHWLHGWLLVHIPLSFAMLLLMVLHIVFALRYGWRFDW